MPSSILNTPAPRIIMYETLKTLHIATAFLSIAGFILRGFWMLQDSPRLQAKPVKILPHVIDTALLASAIALAVMTSLNPLAHAWLSAKIVALLLYIGLGVIALKRGKTREIRFAAFLVAIAVFAYMVQTALTHSVIPF